MPRMKDADLPKQCPTCQQPLTAEHDNTQYSKAGNVAIGITLAFALAWAYYMFFHTSFTITGFGRAFYVLAFIVYGWPLAIGLLIAEKLPKQVTRTCPACRWSQTYQLNSRQRPPAP